MRLRASTMQFGSFLGSIAGGLALAVGGYRAFGATMGIVFFALPLRSHTAGRARTRTPPLGPALSGA